MKINLWRLLLKTAILFVLLNFAFPLIPANNSVSIYNKIVPGRERLPFGENSAQAYNLSLFDTSAMFASHILAKPKADDEFRIILLGDSSVWGTLLRPEETLAGQLNAKNLKTADGRTLRFYNLGYPTISLTKDLLIFEQAMQYEPDLMIWMLTLESFPADKQLTAPLVSHNAARVRQLVSLYGFNADLNSDALISPTYFESTLVGRRRAIADWARLQIYGVMWGITGVDQFYPETYDPAKIDFDADETFHGWNPPVLPRAELALDLLPTAQKIAGNVPLIFVNEPILISDGENSDLRYNYFYPRWAYDQYRQVLAEMSLESSWHYYDFWDIIPADKFTNSAVHLSAEGEAIFADKIAEMLTEFKE